jgi:hypothetical protein
MEMNDDAWMKAWQHFEYQMVDISSSLHLMRGVDKEKVILS